MWTTFACSRSPMKLRAAWRRSCSIRGRSRSWPSVKRGRWTLPANVLDAVDAAKLIDGVAIAKQVRAEVAREAEALKARGVTPGLTVVLVGDNPASAVYVRSKEKACIEAGMNGQTIRLPADTSQADLLALIDRLN